MAMDLSEKRSIEHLITIIKSEESRRANAIKNLQFLVGRQPGLRKHFQEGLNDLGQIRSLDSRIGGILGRKLAIVKELLNEESIGGKTDINNLDFSRPKLESIMAAISTLSGLIKTEHVMLASNIQLEGRVIKVTREDIKRFQNEKKILEGTEIKNRPLFEKLRNFMTRIVASRMYESEEWIKSAKTRLTKKEKELENQIKSVREGLRRGLAGKNRSEAERKINEFRVWERKAREELARDQNIEMRKIIAKESELQKNQHLLGVILGKIEHPAVIGYFNRCLQLLLTQESEFARELKADEAAKELSERLLKLNDEELRAVARMREEIEKIAREQIIVDTNKSNLRRQAKIILSDVEREFAFIKKIVSNIKYVNNVDEHLLKQAKETEAVMRALINEILENKDAALKDVLSGMIHNTGPVADEEKLIALLKENEKVIAEGKRLLNH